MQYAIETKTIKGGDIWNVKLAAGRGAAMRVVEQ